MSAIKKSGAKRQRIIVWSIVGLVVIFATLGALGVFTPKKENHVEYVYAERRDIVETIIANGRIHPEIEVKISPEVSGEITELPVIEGQKVKKGDLLCRIKSDIYQSRLEQTEAQLQAAGVRYSQAKERFDLQTKNLERTRQLFAERAVSEAAMEKMNTDYNMAFNDVQTAHYDVESNREARKQAREALQKTAIFAPDDYYISELSVELGERVVGTAQMAGTQIMRLADLTRMEARVEVAESDIIHVSLNDSVIVHVDAYPDTVFRGVVTQIANAAKQVQSIDQVINYEVRILLLRDSYEYLLEGDMPSPFKPGMSVSVDIITDRADDVWALPIESVTLRKDTTKQENALTSIMQGATDRSECVFLVGQDPHPKASVFFVSTGLQDRDWVQIVSPLPDSARVIVGPYSLVSRTLNDGDPVTPKLRKN